MDFQGCGMCELPQMKIWWGDRRSNREFWFFILRQCPYPLVLKATDEMPVAAGQRVRNSSTRDFFFCFLHRSDFLKWAHFLLELSNNFRKSGNWKAIYRCRQWSFTWFYAGYRLGDKWCVGGGERFICHSCHSSYTSATLGNQQIASFSRHPLAVGLIWECKSPRFSSAMSPSLPHSLHLLPTPTEIIFSATLSCTHTFGFLPGTSWAPCRRVLVNKWGRERCIRENVRHANTQRFLPLYTFVSFCVYTFAERTLFCKWMIWSHEIVP